MPYTNGKTHRIRTLLLLLACFSPVVTVSAQNGNAGIVHGTVTDPSGAVIPGAAVHLANSITGLSRTTTTDATGGFSFANVPFNSYQVDVSASGFSSSTQSVEIRSAAGTNLNLTLAIKGEGTTVTVEANAGDLLENDPTFRTEVDRGLFTKLPLESASSGLSSLVTLSSPGVTADSNGLFHGLGDHASNSFSVDGQSITDQQSKVFSNQLPSNSIQSLEVISGAPPAEYGGKTALVIVATTRSGQGITRPTGAIYGSYGSFGTAAAGLDLSYGGKSWGNFLELDGLNSGRFLDTPEFTVIHARGNEQNVFDRIDYSFSAADSAHLDLNYSRSWFQTPNAFDNLDVQNVIGGGDTPDPVIDSVGDTDQRAQIETFNISPTYTHVISTRAVTNLGAFVRKDFYHYYPSDNPLADRGPANLQTSSIAQGRTLMNAGVHGDYSYAHGIHNFKAGGLYQQTFLDEDDRLGVVDPTYNAPCVDLAGDPQPGSSDPAQCARRGALPNPAYLPVLRPYDLTRGGGLYAFLGHTDIKELGLYAEDQIKAGDWNFNIGLRGDLYNGLTTARQLEPRLGIAYTVKPSKTVMSLSYARTLETPFNENLILSSNGCLNAVLAPLLSCSPGVSGTLQPGFKNEFHAGLQQALGPHMVFSGEYIWKYTHNAFDFSVLGNTPITFPIDWHNSKIPGFVLHLEVPAYHNFSAYSVMSSVSARFFPPQVAGAGASVQSGQPFRIDHDERFNQTTHLQYQIGKRGPWAGWNWRYDSGMVAGQVPFAVDATTPVDLSGLTPDQRAQAGLTCGGVRLTRTTTYTSCAPGEYGSTLLSIPAPGTQNDDKNPVRIAPRNLFDLSVGQQNILHKEHMKLDLDLTAVNITNQYALYNFLSTFSGTHYVTPRTMTAKLTLNF